MSEKLEQEAIEFDDLEILNNKKIGSGYSADVYLAINKKTKKKYAVKIVR